MHSDAFLKALSPIAKDVAYRARRGRKKGVEGSIILRLRESEIKQLIELMSVDCVLKRKLEYYLGKARYERY